MIIEESLKFRVFIAFDITAENKIEAMEMAKKMMKFPIQDIVLLEEPPVEALP